MHNKPIRRVRSPLFSSLLATPLLLLIALLVASHAFAKQTPAATTLDLPPLLQPWQSWVMHDHRKPECTRLARDMTQRVCLWPGRLAVSVGARGGAFTQQVLVEAAGWHYLPGDENLWPQQLQLNGRRASALLRDGWPALWLEAGEHELSGNFDWNEMPQSLAVPPQSALVDLTVGGEPVMQINREQNRLWLRTPADTEAATAASDSVKVEVFRRIDDALPVTVTTMLRLSVSGKARELRLGRLLLPTMEPLDFTAPLPARIEDDGSLRIQARAGIWELTLRSRLLEDQREFRFERTDEQWPAQEIWCFSANSALRRVRVEGAPSVDPNQLDLPVLCHNASVYLLDTDTTLKLEEVSRGDSAPPQDVFNLHRTLWLDFEGDGATLKDRIDGETYRSRRLQAEPAVELGRVVVDGQPQLVTRLGDEGLAGVALGGGAVALEAISRVDRLDELGASGWQADFNRVQLDLQLPPGWMLWHANGPDRVAESWVSQWSLWAIFLSLLVVAALFRLLDWRWAVLGAAAVALVYHDELQLVLLMLPLLLLLALLRVVERPAWRGRLQRLGYGFGALLLLAIVSFAIEQVRIAIYPQLAMASAVETYPREISIQASAPMADSAAELSRYAMKESSAAPSQRPAPPRYQPTDNVQTGPGEPAWSWQSVSMSWSGPVKAEQPLTLYLTGPWMTRLLHFLKVILVVALAAALLRAFFTGRPQTPSATARDASSSGGISPSTSGDASSGGAVPALVLLMMVGLGALAPHPAQAQAVAEQKVPAQTAVPPKEMLLELEERLLRERDAQRERNPACAPNCTAIESALVTVSNNMLRLDLRVAVGANLAVALPTIENWQPRAVLVDDFPQRGVAVGADGALLLSLPRGSRAVLLEGPLYGDDVTLQFPQRPYRISVGADGWEVFGLNGDRLAANSLQLQRQQRSAQSETLLPPAIKPFVRVQRDLNIDLDWRVTTTVTRVAPQSGAINLTLPLLPGESVVSGDVDTDVVGNKRQVRISLGSQDRSFSWQSTLTPQDLLALTATQTTQWVENWRLHSSWRWLVEANGLVPVRGDGDSWQVWRPWPGETLTLHFSRPQAVAGATTTVERARLHLRPGARSSALRAELEINSSLGGDYPLQLAEPAQVKRVALGGEELAHLGSDASVVLPLVPGINRIEVEWELERGISTAMSTPQLQLDSAGNNIDIEVELPGDRWPLWVSGPRLGPAMLYWGVLVVMIGAALLLGAVSRRFNLSIPLRSIHWLLLFIGISTVDTFAALPVLLWFFALEARHRFPPPRDGRYYLVQLGIGLVSFIALMTLAGVIPQSLLSQPDMQVTGNGSHNYFYRWYQDRSGNELPQALVISLPLWCYRIAMLLWSLWLAFALLSWLRWGWNRFAEGGVWPKGLRATKPVAPKPTPQADGWESAEEGAKPSDK